MPFSSDIHTVTYLSKGCVDKLARLFCRDLLGFSAEAPVNCGEAAGYYGELMGIKGLNWLSKHFINGGGERRLSERFVGF